MVVEIVEESEWSDRSLAFGLMARAAFRRQGREKNSQGAKWHMGTTTAGRTMSAPVATVIGSCGCRPCEHAHASSEEG